MEFKLDKQKTVTRLAVCVIAAVVLYVALNKFGGKIPQLAPYLPWLEENKVQAIAIAAAVLFGASMMLLPLEECPAPPPPMEDGSCEGYERTCDLP